MSWKVAHDESPKLSVASAILAQDLAERWSGDHAGPISLKGLFDSASATILAAGTTIPEMGTSDPAA